MSRHEIRFSGFGGQGIITAGYILGKAAALYDGRHVTLIKSYGPESRGGASSAQLIISDEEIKLGRREAVCDVARVMSRYVDLIMIRTFDQAEIEELARYASVPVINALTDMYHPCQVMGDLMTVKEHKGKIEGLKVAFLGDGNNVANSWVNAAAKIDFHLVLGMAEGYEPDSGILERARDSLTCLLTSRGISPWDTRWTLDCHFLIICT